MADNQIKFFLELIRMNMKQSYALKTAFWLRVLFMLISNGIMLVGWGVMFHQFQSINGWTFSDFMFMTGLNITAFSIWSLFFRGTGIYMAHLIENGGLDHFLLTPKNILFHISCSVSNPAGWGDFITGFCLILASNLVCFSNAFLVLIFLICSVLCFLTIGFFFSALNFWLAGFSDLSERLFYIFFNLSGYPGSIYSDWAKILLLTVFPIGFISILPVEILKTFSLPSFLYLIMGISFLFIGSILFFYNGLKRYKSGNQINMRGYQ